MTADIAILLHPDNVKTILATEAVHPDKVTEWMKRFGPESIYTRLRGTRYYFIPSYTNVYKNINFGATVISEEVFGWNGYLFDFDAAENQFAPFTRTK